MRVCTILQYQYPKKGVVHTKYYRAKTTSFSLNKNLLMCYKACNNFWFTRWYIEKVGRGFEILYPGEKTLIASKTMKTIFLLWGLSIASIFLLFLRQPSLYTAAIGILLIVILHYEIVNGMIRTMEMRLLKQLEQFLSDVRHSYYINQMIEEAVADAMENCKFEMKIHAAKLYRILSGEDLEEEANRYHETVPNKFLRLFLALSITVIEYGDQEVEGQSLFLNNIKTLKNDIHIELLKLSDTKFRFSGLVLIAVVPVFFLHTIKDWSVSNLPELNHFYSSPMGIFLAISIYIITIISYIMLNQLKEIQSIISKDHYILEKLIKVPFIHKILENYIEKHYGRVIYIKEVLKRSGDNLNVKQFLLKRILFGVISFVSLIIIFLYVHIRNGTGFLLWQEVLMACPLSYLAYCFPYWMVLYRRKIMQMNMEDEIIQYQSIIMMLMYIKRISVLNILELMESFAILFKDSIQNCINDFNAGDIQALETMKENESFEPFKRLVDSLLISDSIGIEKAFDEITVDHVYFQDKRKQENEMNLSKKVVIGKLIAYVPILMTIGLYLIIPFILESFRQLLTYTEEMKFL